jgi:transposase InsO family protein
LVDLTRKETEFHWDTEQQEAFEKLKDLVSSAPALRSIDYSSDKPVYLSVDTSVHGIGMILSQDDENDRRIPARYGSIPLGGFSDRYGQSKLELYGLFRALHKFRAYLSGVKNLIVEVDASSIGGMLKRPDIVPGATMNRWIKGIKQFLFELVHVPADKHKGPDALSRRRRATDEEDFSQESDPEDWIDSIALAAEIREDPLSSRSPSFPSQPTPAPIHLTPQPPSPLPHLEDATFLDDSVKASYAVSSSHQYSDEDLVAILRYLVTKKTPNFRFARQRKAFLKKAEPFYMEEAHMYKRRLGYPTQVVIFPKQRRKEILWEAHEDIAHHGVWAVEQFVTLRYFWPGMRQQIKEHVQSCHTCQIRSTKKMHIPITVSHPPRLFSKVYVDVMSMPLARGKRWLINCRDDLSGVTECKAIARDKAKVMARFFLKKIILRYGIVLEVVTDNGPSFGKEFSDLLEKYGIRHIKISPYNSQANGPVERGHYNIREALVKLCKGDLSKWPLFVSAANYADRITVRKSTGYSPYYLLHGIHPLLPGDLTDATLLVDDFEPGMTRDELVQARARQLLRLPEDIAKARKILQKSRFKSKEAYEKKFARRLRKTAYRSGDLVLVRNNRIENSVSIERKTADRYMGPYRVIRQTQGGSYILEEMDSSELAEHIAAYRLIPYVKRQDLDQWANLVTSDNEAEDENSQEQSGENTQESQQESDSDSSTH